MKIKKELSETESVATLRNFKGLATMPHNLAIVSVPHSRPGQTKRHSHAQVIESDEMRADMPERAVLVHACPASEATNEQPDQHVFHIASNHGQTLLNSKDSMGLVVKTSRTLMKKLQSS